jgi:D-aminopeptidase
MMSAFPAGPKNSLTDVPGVRVGHLTRRDPSSREHPAHIGLTAIFTIPPEPRRTRPAAIVTMGGRTEVSGLNLVDDFGFVTGPIVATSLRALGRVHDAMISRLTRVPLGWPPIVVGLDDGRLMERRGPLPTDEEVARALDAASDEKVEEGVVGAASGLVAFGYKSGVGSASRQVVGVNPTYTVGALALLNMGRREALRVGGAAARVAPSASAAPPPLLGSAVIVVATDAPLDDRQCRLLATASLQGLGRLGAVPGTREGLVAYAVSTGVLMTRGDRTASQIELPYSPAPVVGALTEAAADAAEEAGLRTLTSVAPTAGTPSYPAMPRGTAERRQ